MRTEKTIIDLVIKVAEEDDQVRAVLLNGSRANPMIAKDMFQDFDIVYIVDQIETFLKDHSWINVFGERIILQMPAQMELENDTIEGSSFSYLVLLQDRNRIDLTLFPLDKMDSEFVKDSLTIVLLDKDNLFPNIAATSDVDYHIKEPTEKLFLDYCNEFWWVSTYVAKGLWRKQVLYAKDMLENPVRKMFLKMIEWHVGVEYGFDLSIGKSGKNLQAILAPDRYSQLISTYSDASIEHTWSALFTMTKIFNELAVEISGKLAFEYNQQEAANVMSYLNWVHQLTNTQ